MPLSFSLTEALLLLVASLLAGALNAVAGGGTFFTFPSLIFTGVPPVAANATSSVAVWPGVIASLYGYRHHIKKCMHLLPVMLGIGLLGGWIGAELLLMTSNDHFRVMVPWLLLIATFLFGFGKQISQWASSLQTEAASSSWWRRMISYVVQMVVAIYGGFFGAGFGILILAMLQCSGFRDMHQMNAIKNALGCATHGIAVITFMFSSIVLWPQAMVMIVGAMLGGYGGARLALKVPQFWIRLFVMMVGISLTLYFFFDVYA